ncbi:uncharacterized protein LOC118181382 isoform X2 [Stegodyphus dumicola]|nr:uncharacterized protein LOC118181382 isoform X2 [Stegodyphus dumicola]
MHLRVHLPTLAFLAAVCRRNEALLFPLLFPLSIKITIHSNHKPTPPPVHDYHFESVPLYKEVVVKGNAHISDNSEGYKHSYGDGHKYGTSYGDGHIKVYTNEPHVKGHSYSKGYGTGGGDFSGSVYAKFPSSSMHYKGSGFIGNGHLHYKGSLYSEPEKTHYKGTDYKSAPPFETHYKGTDYNIPPNPGTHFKGKDYNSPPNPGTHFKGTNYNRPPNPGTHFKGTDYSGAPNPETHYKGTDYNSAPDSGTHYKGSDYSANPETHYKDSSYHSGADSAYDSNDYQAPPSHYKGGNYNGKKTYQKEHGYIKSVGGYKMSDFIRDYGSKSASSEDDDDRYPVAIPAKVAPGNTYAEIAAAHQASLRGGGPKAYAAEEYSDLGAKQQYKKDKDYEHEPEYLDDTPPGYKSSAKRPVYKRPVYDTKRTGPLNEEVHSTEPTSYAGYGTRIYGDSYAKVIYQPKTLKISISATSH